ncbi:MAG: ribonuclease HI family protein [Planctomycetes bacterium]|nr:ribonuclease HI family protein [Planctomycetota bacterium]
MSGDAGRVFVLHTDGGARGNPGPAAAAIVLTDGTGKTIHTAGRFLGRSTNNVAEYEAMVMGLEEASRRGVRRLTVRTDSELMVRQLNGQYKVSSPALKPLYALAMELIGRFDNVDIRHVFREKNVLADELVNRTLDAHGSACKARGAGAAQQAYLLSTTFTAKCTTGGGDGCTCGICAGDEWVFDGETPAGLCVYAAACILAVVAAAKASDKTLTARCAKPTCRAAFSVTLAN